MINHEHRGKEGGKQNALLRFSKTYSALMVETFVQACVLKINFTTAPPRCPPPETVSSGSLSSQNLYPQKQFTTPLKCTEFTSDLHIYEHPRGGILTHGLECMSFPRHCSHGVRNIGADLTTKPYQTSEQ